MSAPRPYGPRPLPRWLLVAVIGGSLALLAGLWFSARTRMIELVNGLEVDVDVQIGGAKKTVARGSRVEMRVPIGSVAIVSTAGIVELERLLVNVPSSGRVLYNVVGAAFLYRQAITYSARETPSEFTFFCGQSFLDVGPIDYWFEAPPRSITIKAKATAERRTQLAWQNDSRHCPGWLYQQGNFKGLASLAQVRARLHPTDVAIVSDAAMALVAANQERTALALVDALARAQTRGELRLEAQLHRQRIYALTERIDVLRKEFAAPPPAVAAEEAYLYARIQEPKERIAYLDTVVKQNPAAVLPRLGLAYALTEEDPARAVALYEKLLTEDLGSRRRSTISDYVQALVVAGRASDAWDLLQTKPLGGAPTPDEVSMQVVVASLAKRPDIERTGLDARTLAWSDVLRGLPPSGEETNPMISAQLKVAGLARKQQPHLMTEHFKSSDFLPSAIPTAWLWAMICELDRMHPSSIALLEPGLGADRRLIPRVLHFVRTGEPFANMDRLLNSGERSAVWLGRLRWLQAHDAPSTKNAIAAANAEVTRLDAFGLWGAALRKTWEVPTLPPPSPRNFNQWSVLP